MTKTATAGLAMVGGMTCIVAVSTAWLVRFDGPGLVGLAAGAGLGLLNLAVGYRITVRALRGGMERALRTLLAGFLVRLAVLAVLILLFGRVEAVDATAFALSFMFFFFVYLVVEVLLVQRAMDGNGSPA